MQVISAKSIARAVQVANALREAFGANPIDDLPVSRPGDPEECILARAFNFDCEINGLCSSTGVQAHFDRQHRAQAEKLAELVGTDLEVDDDHATVRLPAEIGNIAVAFDACRLPPRYYEAV